MNQERDRTDRTTPAGQGSPSQGSASKGSAPAKPDHRLAENRKENLDEKLDQGVEESFPASDPVSVKITK